jgi:hypothetical protein
MNWDVDYSWFEERIWPLLAERVPQFETIKVINAWVGQYDYNALDQNAVIGPHPQVKNFYFANGFSGHGLQQGPATGNAIAELIVHGTYRTIDLTRFSYDASRAMSPCLKKTLSDAPAGSQHFIASGLWSRWQFRLRAGPPGGRLHRIAGSHHHSFQSSRPRQALRREIARSRT